MISNSNGCGDGRYNDFNDGEPDIGDGSGDPFFVPVDPDFPEYSMQGASGCGDEYGTANGNGRGDGGNGDSAGVVYLDGDGEGDGHEFSSGCGDGFGDGQDPGIEYCYNVIATSEDLREILLYHGSVK